MTIKHTKGEKLLPHELIHCFCCINAEWFSGDYNNKNVFRDMTVQCRHYPYVNKVSKIGCDCSHFGNAFGLLNRFYLVAREILKAERGCKRK
jgi:hypothetical protein